MPLIHSGVSTHHHDQAITPVSLSTMSTGSARINRLWPRCQVRLANDSNSLRTVTTTASG